MPDKLMSQKDFLARLKAEVPELKDIDDNQLMMEVFNRKPDLRSKVENPLAGDASAQAAQEKAQSRATTFAGHPKLQQIAKGLLDTIPAVGGMLGGAASTPETFGLGTLPGAALGVGAGRGLRDLISEGLMIEPKSSPIQKAKNIGMDTGLAAITPGVMTAVGNPIKTARMAAGALSSAEDAIIPKGLRSFVKMPFLEDFAQGGRPKITPNISNFANEVPSIAGEVVPEGQIMNGKNVTEGVFKDYTPNPIPKNPMLDRSNVNYSGGSPIPKQLPAGDEDLIFRQSVAKNVGDNLSTKAPWQTEDWINKILGIEPEGDSLSRILQEQRSMNKGGAINLGEKLPYNNVR